MSEGSACGDKIDAIRIVIGGFTVNDYCKSLEIAISKKLGNLTYNVIVLYYRLDELS